MMSLFFARPGCHHYAGTFMMMLLTLLATTTTTALPDVVSSLSSDLDYDEHGKTATHYLLWNEACQTADDDVAKFEPRSETGFLSRKVTGQAAEQLFGGADNKAAANVCHAVCIERGVDRAVAYAAMPHKFFDRSRYTPNYKFMHWFDETCSKVEVCFMNYHSKTVPLKIMWFKPGTQEWVVHLPDLGYGERKTRCFSSFLGHEFQARDGETDAIVDDSTYVVHFPTIKSFGGSPVYDIPPTRNWEREIKTTLDVEWERHNKVTRTFSPLGFKKGRLPADIFASMGSFYYNNRNHKVNEEWSGKGVFVNWWETDCSFIQIPWGLKNMWQRRLKELVEAWAGVTVEQTDMYGLRQYEAGARLLTHVDRISTHAVSLIVNIAQGNLTEPWPVEVQDHQDRLHEVIMEPGDVVYYESAKCLHGRNRPLTGPNAYYVNLFTHYRPIGDPNWYEKQNTPETPAPVLDAAGSCRLQKVGTTETPTGQQLGVVEAVQCDDKRLGKYISPSLFTASNGADLFQWWRMTGGMQDPMEETTTSAAAPASGDEL